MTSRVYMEYYANGSLYRELYYEDDKVHRDNGPAIITYGLRGNVISELYLQNDLYHRDNDLPALERYNDSGNKTCEEWYISGKLHRNVGPAAIWYRSGGTVSYTIHAQDSKNHRIDGPAIIYYGTDGITVTKTEYHVNGKLMSRSKFLKKYDPAQYEKYCLDKVYHIAGKKYKIELIRSDYVSLRRIANA